MMAFAAALPDLLLRCAQHMILMPPTGVQCRALMLSVLLHGQ
jgi:hypothetical protein